MCKKGVSTRSGELQEIDSCFVPPEHADEPVASEPLRATRSNDLGDLTEREVELILRDDAHLADEGKVREVTRRQTGIATRIVVGKSIRSASSSRRSSGRKWLCRVGRRFDWIAGTAKLCDGAAHAVAVVSATVPDSDKMKTTDSPVPPCAPGMPCPADRRM